MRKRKRCFFRFRVSKGLSHVPIGYFVNNITKILRHEVRRIDIIRLTQLVRRLARHKMNDLHKLYIALRHEKTETIFFRFRVSKGLSHCPIGRGVD